ncbi:MurR/RpiR family transcriptional regulator [Pelomonas sp. CA6]|uniref:MurR/RpiR family transcriptional regulator n=1 Tax=Pelomonas sp. CA6 TaxID=2907999 RepID=UPI001F4C29E2|nr:MurR/RpiR family transcriptional regulator [Pelomonas sp. CA6]MCH7344241.1 MurR/RpiR family transcriptional regulator [Pelomonas sp. CA6]
MRPTRLVHQLNQQLPALPSAQQNVVRLILADPRAAMAATVELLADRAGVSMPTIVRTCRAFGFDSVREFMVALAQDIAVGGSYLHRSVTPQDAPREVIGKLMAAASSSLARLRDELDERAVVAAADAMAGAERIDCYSAGATSAFMASDLQSRLFRLGLHSNAFSDAHHQLVSASSLGRRGVAFAVSHVGRMPHLLEAVRFARSQGATVVALTQPETPLALAADIVLRVSVPADAVMRVGTEAYIAHLMVLDVLTVLVAQRLGPRAAERLQQFKRVLEDHGIDSDSHSALASWGWPAIARPPDAAEMPQHSRAPPGPDP